MVSGVYGIDHRAECYAKPVMNLKQMEQERMPISSSPFRIISFCCQNAISGERDLAGKERVLFEPAIKIVTLPCSSKIETLGIIKAFESGVDGIFVIGCPDDKCHLLGGNYRARKIIKYTKISIKPPWKERFGSVISSRFGKIAVDHFSIQEARYIFTNL